MTDERIKEEFERWAVNPYSQEEINFAFTTCETNERKASFYAGFRTAERLAKIEALEGVRERLRPIVDSKYMTGYQRAGEDIDDIVDSMIAELKEANR